MTLQTTMDFAMQSGKTSPASFQPMTTPLAVSFQRLSEAMIPACRQMAADGPVRVWLPGHGHGSLGGFSTLNISDWPNDASVCSLSSILEVGPIPQRYYLSAKACRGILRRAAKRGKMLPELLEAALTAVADSEPISNAPADCSLSPLGGGNRSGAIDHAATLTARGHKCDFEVETFVAHALRGEGFDASEDGTGRGTPIVPMCFSSKDHGADALSGLAPTMRAMGHADSHANAGGQLEVAEPFTLAIRGRGDDSNFEYRQDGTANAVLTPNGGRAGMGVGAIATRWAVRRLTPRECERLQGFPDDYTLVPDGRGKPAADGPRYKQLGNSMAVNVMRWIGERIDTVLSGEGRVA
jgi:hypothetical protein